MHKYNFRPVKIREKQTIPINSLEDLSTPCAPTADTDWWRIECHLREFWERCQEQISDYGIARLDDLSALAGLEPILEDLLWVSPAPAENSITQPYAAPDFVYDFVGANVCESNGRDFEGDRILEKAARNVSDNGGAGLQAELYTRMTMALATGQVIAYRGAMVNAKKTTCEIRVRLLPVGMRSDRVTDLIGAATIKRARMN